MKKFIYSENKYNIVKIVTLGLAIAAALGITPGTEVTTAWVDMPIPPM